MLGPDAKLEESDDDEGAGEGGASREDVVATIIGNNVRFSRTHSTIFSKNWFKSHFSKGGYDFFIEPDPDDMEGHRWIEAETRGLTCGTEESDKVPKNASKETEHRGHEELQDETTLKYGGIFLI